MKLFNISKQNFKQRKSEKDLSNRIQYAILFTSVKNHRIFQMEAISGLV